jgi:hypothetical protein
MVSQYCRKGRIGVNQHSTVDYVRYRTYLGSEREERPWFEARTLGENPVELRQSLLRMSAIATRYPQITIVPSHDPRGYASIPEWSASATQ